MELDDRDAVHSRLSSRLGCLADARQPELSREKTSRVCCSEQLIPTICETAPSRLATITPACCGFPKCPYTRTCHDRLSIKELTMKTIATLAALSVALFAGCASTQNTAAPGAVGATKSDCCATKSTCSETKQADPGAVGAEKSGCSAKAECSATKSECSTMKAAPASAPGAVGTKKSGCCSGAAKCPVTQN